LHTDADPQKGSPLGDAGDDRLLQPVDIGETRRAVGKSPLPRKDDPIGTPDQVWIRADAYIG
jgi:hypothetical protein